MRKIEIYAKDESEFVRVEGESLVTHPSRLVGLAEPPLPTTTCSNSSLCKNKWRGGAMAWVRRESRQWCARGKDSFFVRLWVFLVLIGV